MTETLQTGSGAGPEPKPSRRLLPAVARILMGLIFFIFGLNGFLHFIPQPKTPMPEGALAFATALMNTGYMMPLVSGTQLLVGVLLLLNLFVPRPLALTPPFFVGFFSSHFFPAPAPGARPPGKQMIPTMI